MTGRIPFGLLTLLTVLVCAPIQAQDQMGSPPDDGVFPAGFHANQGQVGQYHGFPLTYQRDQGPRTPGTAPATTYEQLPDDLGFHDEDTEFGKLLTRTFAHAWYRSEYLQWTASRPGEGILGAQPSDGIPAQTPGTGGPLNVPITAGATFSVTPAASLQPATAQSPALDGLTNLNSNGYRGTFGLPVPVGQLEFSAFVLARNSTSMDGNAYIQPFITPIPSSSGIGRFAPNSFGPPVGTDSTGATVPAVNGQAQQIYSQALQTNGVQTPFASSAFLNYDRSYQATLSTFAWGTEGNYVADSIDPNSPFQFRPIYGFRYFNFRDSLNQRGQYNQPTTDPATGNITLAETSRSIDSSANNNMFGPQIGARAEFAYSRLILGVEPKIMMGVNSWQQNLNTSQVLSPTDPSQSLLSRGTNFAPLIDLKGYSSIMLSKYVSAYCAYNYIWAGSVTRSYNDIIYNQNTRGATTVSDFGLKNQLTNVSLQGISLGIDIRY